MLDRTYFENGHLSKTALEALVNGTLSDRDTQLLLIHLEHCPGCMEAYIGLMDAAELETPPEGLEQRIVDEIEQLPDRPSKSPVSMGLLRLAVAVCLTMLLFFCNVFHLVYTYSENLTQRISISSEQPRDPILSDLASGFQQGFNNLVNRFNDLFSRDALQDPS